ncbi:MAG: hypothetical protein M3209_20250 [Acidobacteriota bacterium]|nr:hypothetical protein [Acidobacteriota bacterium]
MPDRKADGLQGKVKEVVQEYVLVNFENGNQTGSKRLISSVTEYDQNGNRIKRASYSSGKLASKTKYGLLNGEKISIEERIEDKDNPPIFQTPSVKSTANKPADNRYNYKFKYNYDDKGNRIEEFWIENDGDLWIRDVITFENGKVTKSIRYHRGEDKISSKVRYEYDEKGRLKKQIHLNPDDTETEKHEPMKFDSQGNWIEERVSKPDRFGNFQVFLIGYRKITNFQ